MRIVVRLLALGSILGAGLFAGPSASAQHGHPLVGSWSGDWMPPGAAPQRLLLVLRYDNDEISGQVYFGTRRVPLTLAELDPSTWTVHFEARDAGAGDAVGYVFDGRILNLGSTTERTIAGRLTANGTSGDFTVVMN